MQGLCGSATEKSECAAKATGKESVQEQYLDLRSSFLTLGRVDASIALLSLNQNLLHKLS